jgi:hypothetical protein
VSSAIGSRHCAEPDRRPGLRDVSSSRARHLTAKGLKLATGTIVDATIISAPSSTKNADQARDPEMHQTKKGNQCGGSRLAHSTPLATNSSVKTNASTVIFRTICPNFLRL